MMPLEVIDTEEFWWHYTIYLENNTAGMDLEQWFSTDFLTNIKIILRNNYHKDYTELVLSDMFIEWIWPGLKNGVQYGTTIAEALRWYDESMAMAIRGIEAELSHALHI